MHLYILYTYTYLAGAIERSSMLQSGKRFKTLSSIGITRILALTATKLRT